MIFCFIFFNLSSIIISYPLEEGTDIGIYANSSCKANEFNKHAQSESILSIKNNNTPNMATTGVTKVTNHVVKQVNAKGKCIASYHSTVYIYY